MKGAAAIALVALAGCVVEHSLGSDEVATSSTATSASAGATSASTGGATTASSGGGEGGGPSGGGAAGAGAGDGGGGAAPTLDVSGQYHVVLTEGLNGCDFADLTEGEVSEADVAILQEDAQMTVIAQNYAAVSTLLLLGTTEWNGALVDRRFVVVAKGTTETQQPDCAYPWESVIDGVVGDDGVLRGEIAYRPDLPDEPACEAYACESSQTFVATRDAP